MIKTLISLKYGLEKMLIDGFQKLTLLDFPDTVACIVFTKGCNCKCPFCYNSPLVLDKTKTSNYTDDEIFNYLEKRRGLIDGIVVSGGEATLQKNLKEFISRVKMMNFKVKLDTNGTNPDVLKELIECNILDYVAMDIKNCFDKYEMTIGTKKDFQDDIKKSIEILKKSNIDYEFRTTIVKEFHTISDIKKILKYIDGSKYFIQNYQDNENVIKKGLHSFSKEELIIINNELSKEFTNFKIRGL